MGKRCNVNQKDFVSEFKTDYVKSFYILQQPPLDFFMHQVDHYLSILMQLLAQTA